MKEVRTFGTVTAELLRLGDWLHEEGVTTVAMQSTSGLRWLRSTMVEAAWSASRVRNSYFAAQYHRLAARPAKRRAAVAVADSMLIAIYHLIKHGTVYQDLGPNHFDELDRQRIAHRAVRRLQALGYS